MKRRCIHALAAISAVLLLALLWITRPPLFDLPRELTTSSTGPAAYVLSWSIISAFALFAFVRAVRLTLHRRLHGRAPSSPHWLSAGRPRRRVGGGPMALWPSGAPSQLLIRADLEGAAPRPRVSAARARDGATAAAGGESTGLSHIAGESIPDQQAAPGAVVSVLGPLTISGSKRPRRGLRAAAVELIAYLALRPQGASRDEVLEALWPGEDPQKSRERLYQATRDARRLLGEALANEHDRYRLERDQVRVDADELEQLLRAADAAEEPERTRLLERALALFRSEPLAGADYRWAEGDLRRLRASYADVLKRVGRTRLAAGDARGTLELAERALSIDQLNEEFWRLAIEAESALGLREAVANRYECLRRLLEQRLGLAPAQATRALYLQRLGQD